MRATARARVGFATSMALALACAIGGQSPGPAPPETAPGPVGVVAPPPPSAPPPPAAEPNPVESAFQLLCKDWMGKLVARESHNLENARVRQIRKLFVLEYTGYGADPIVCRADRSRRSNGTFIGRLVYQELRYRKTARSRARALASKPRITDRIEVLELFRNDGNGWNY